MPAAFACASCGCTNQHPCWDDAHNTTCHWITPTICSVCWYADLEQPEPQETHHADAG